MKQKSVHKKTHPLQNEKDVENNPDANIKQDFPGFPHDPSAKTQIKPLSKADKITANIDSKEGEKRNKTKHETDEEDSDGSADAFERTEEVNE